MNCWRESPLPMIWLGVIVIVVSLLIGFSSHYQGNQQALLNQAKIAYNNASENLQVAKQEQQEIAHYLPKYQFLLRVGFIGEERRHDWLARLHQVVKEYQLFNIDYEIQQQTAYEPEGIFKLSRYKMQRSVMNLKWGLLHEEDFIHFLTGLREDTSPFMVRDCEIELAPDTEINSYSLQENLTASCTIDWLTIPDSSVKADF